MEKTPHGLRGQTYPGSSYEQLLNTLQKTHPDKNLSQLMGAALRALQNNPEDKSTKVDKSDAMELLRSKAEWKL